MHWQSILLFFSVFKKPSVFKKWFRVNTFLHKNILYINIYLKKHMEKNLSNFMQAQYTNSG